jgi:hypothetical protein
MPGQAILSKEPDSIDFHKKMAAIGAHILLSLPNGTAVTAKIDQLYSKFKPRCSNITIRVASIKMAKCAVMRKKHAAKAPLNFDAPIELDLEDSDESSESKDDESPACTKKATRSICNVSMDNRDLSNIGNGFLGNSLENRPFSYTLTKKKSYICG